MFIILLGITLTSIALTAVYGVQEEILKLFLELSEPDVKRLYTQCEVFVSNLQVGEDDDNNSDLDNASKQINEDEVDDMDQNTMKKKKKKSKNSSNYQMSILPIIVIGNFFPIKKSLCIDPWILPGHLCQGVLATW